MEILSSTPKLRRMKRFCLFLLIAFGSCGVNSPDEPIAHFYAPAANTIVAADSMKVEDDPLNELYFAIRLKATDSSSAGSYLMEAHYGFNEAKTEIRFPKLQQTIYPAIEVDAGMPYSYLVGFRYKDDSVFHDYARLNAVRMPGVVTQMEFRYVKAYIVDSVKK